MEFTIEPQGSAVPNGAYTAVFEGVTDAPPHPEYGNDGIRWQFRICAGPHTGSVVSRTTKRKAQEGTVTHKMVTGLCGLKGVGQKANVTDCIGKKYLIVVGQGPKGGIRVESVNALPAA